MKSLIFAVLFCFSLFAHALPDIGDAQVLGQSLCEQGGNTYLCVLAIKEKVNYLVLFDKKGTALIFILKEEMELIYCRDCI